MKQNRSDDFEDGAAIRTFEGIILSVCMFGVNIAFNEPVCVETAHKFDLYLISAESTS